MATKKKPTVTVSKKKAKAGKGKKKKEGKKTRSSFRTRGLAPFSANPCWLPRPAWPKKGPDPLVLRAADVLKLLLVSPDRAAGTAVICCPPSSLVSISAH